MVRVEGAREDIYPVVEAVGMWEGWEAGFMAFHAFHTLSFPWPAFRVVNADKITRYAATQCNAPHSPSDAHRYSWLVIEFYKKGCQEKSSPSIGRREDFCLEIQPTAVSVPLDSLESFVVACLPYPWLSSSSGDDANRVLDLASGPWYLGVNHGSIRGSWPIAISGYPRRHSVTQ
jgi:hypothetical protein